MEKYFTTLERSVFSGVPDIPDKSIKALYFWMKYQFHDTAESTHRRKGHIVAIICTLTMLANPIAGAVFLPETIRQIFLMIKHNYISSEFLEAYHEILSQE